MLLFICILCFIQEIKSAISTIRQTLNPTQQKYVQELNLTYLEQYIYITAEFKYVPLSYLFYNNSQFEQNENKYIIFSLTSDKSIAILTYLRIDQTFTYCIEIKLINNETQIQSFDLIEIVQDPLVIEGNWFTLELRNNLAVKQVNVAFYQNQNMTNIFQKIYSNFNIEVSENFEIQAGYTQDIEQKYHLFFEGPIRLQILDKNTRFYPLSISCNYNSYYEINPISYFDQSNLEIHQIFSNINRCFGISAWIKVNQTNEVDQVNVIKILANPNSKMSEQSELLNLRYLISKDSSQIELDYQSYAFPTHPFKSNVVNSIQKSTTILVEKSLYEWHYMSITYKEQQISLSLSFPQQPQDNIVKVEQKVYMYSDTNQTIFFGGYIKDQKYYYSNTIGQFNQLRYYSRLGSTFPLPIQCHDNCQTCFGPYSNQCLSCLASGNREYFVKTHQCLCKIGYEELGFSLCEDLYPEKLEIIIPLSNKQGYDSEYPYVVCSFGYFKYENICYQCPKVNRKYPCFLCLANPNTWVYEPKCLKTQVQQIMNDDNSPYTPNDNLVQLLFFQDDQYDVYVFQDLELILCEYCRQLCLTLPLPTECQLSNYKHLQKQTFIICQLRSKFIDGKCKSSYLLCLVDQIYFGEYVCYQYNVVDESYPIQNCLYYRKNQCQQCMDNYFLSYDSYLCLPCQIQKCKVCFQYSIQDPSQISITNIDKQINQEDLAIGCALCYEGYQFNFFIGECEIIQQQYADCLKQYIHFNQNVICYETSTNDFSKGLVINGCQNYMYNCKKCIQPVANQYFCTECQSGYYYNRYQGICLKCSNYDNHFVECKTEYSLQKDQILKEVLGFAFQFSGIYPINFLSDQVREMIIPLSCIDGYALIFEGCVEINQAFCFQFDQQCVQCESNKYGTKRLTVMNMTCQECPFYCEYCQKRSQPISQLNPYYNNSQTFYKYQCLQKTSRETLFIDNFYGHVRPCNSTISKCQTQILFISTTLSDLNDYLAVNLDKQVEYMALKGVSIITFQLNITQNITFTGSFSFQEYLTNQFVYSLLTLQQTEIVFNGLNLNNLCTISFGLLVIESMQKLLIQNLQLNFSIYFNSSIKTVSIDSFQLYMINVTIMDSYLKPPQNNDLNLVAPDNNQFGRAYEILIQNPQIISLINVTIYNMSMLNTTFLNLLNSNNVNLDQVVIEDFTFINCNFTNTNFLTLAQNIQYQKIRINNMKIQNCIFQNGSIVQFSDYYFKGNFQIQNLSFYHSNFFNSILINLPQSKLAIMTNIVFNQCKFQNSSAFQIRQSSTFQLFIILDCEFQQSSLISSSIYGSNQIQLYFDQMNFSSIKLKNSNLIEIISDYKIFYFVSNIHISGIVKSNQISTSTVEKVFYCQGYSFQLTNITMLRFNGIIEFCLENFQIVELFHLIANSNMDQIVNQILYVSSSIIIIDDFIIQNQNSEDTIFISIFEGTNNQENYKKITNLKIYNVKMKKTKFKFSSSIIQIVSQIDQEITIQNSLFVNIWQNQELQNPEISTASLMVLNVPQSSIFIQNLKIHNCLISNATDSLILTNSKSLNLEQCFTNMTNNIQFYFRNLNIEIDPSQMQQMSYGGLAYIQVQELTIQNSQFFNSIGQYGGVFYIITKFNGILNVYGLKFENISTFQSSYIQGMGGCFYVDSQYSYLQLNMFDIFVKNSSSNYLGGFIYIKPSIHKNIINFNNIQFLNVFSSQQSIISFTQIYYQQNNSTISLNNITILNDENNYQEFLDFYRLNNSESSYGQITIQGNIISISKLICQGYYQESILYIENSRSFKLNQANIYNSQFDCQTLLLIKDISQDKHTSIYVSQLEQYNILEKNLQLNKTTLISLILSSKCILAEFDNINIYNVTCQGCQQGILSLQTNSLNVSTTVKFQNLIMTKNICGFNGCLNLQSNSSENYYQIINIKKSKFIENTANMGGSIYINNLQLQIKSTLFLQNTANDSGGAIYYMSEYNIYLEDCYFYKNKAYAGGAIYLGQNSQIQNKSLLQFSQNSARSFANNLAEQPKFLQLIVNQQGISNYRQQRGQMVIDQPILKQSIYFPTGITLSEYEYFNYTSRLYSSIKYSIYLKAYNHVKEEIIFLDETQCTVSYGENEVKSFNFQEGSETSSDQIIVFNSTKQYYDLNELLIINNPYDVKQYLMLDIQCTCIQDDYHLQFSIQTLKCQIGEYYNDGLCIRCNAAAGYYSVAYNSTSCKRIDIKMINQTNGAMLQLQESYWRPNIRSDQIEKCQKFPSKCLGGWFPGDLSCTLGSLGALCEECDIYNIRGDGQFLNSGQATCSVCGYLSVQILLLLISSFWSAFLIIMTVKSTNNSLQKLAQLKVIYLKYQTMYTFSLDQTSILIKMSNNYFQILMVISSFQIDFFKNIKNALQFLGDASSFVTYQIDCTSSQITETPIIYSHFIMIILIPFFNFALSTIIYCISIMAKVIKFSNTFIFTTIIYLYIYNQQSILNWGTSLISKRSISGEDYIQASVYYFYNTQEHFNWLYRFVIPIVAILGIIVPLLLLYYLYHNRLNLYNKNSRKVLSYLVNEYSDQSYYWELIKMAQKLLIIMIINFLEQFILIKGMLIYIIIILYYQLLTKFKPYRQSQFNVLEQTISYYVAMTILLSLLLYQIQNLETNYFQLSLIILILYLIIKLVWLLIEKTFIAFFKRLDEQFDPIRASILLQFPSLCRKFPSLRKIFKLRKLQKQRILERFCKIKFYLKLQIVRSPFKDSTREQIKARESKSLLLISQHRNTFTSMEKYIMTQGNETLK